jgi:hypothetical protein
MLIISNLVGCVLIKKIFSEALDHWFIINCYLPKLVKAAVFVNKGSRKRLHQKSVTVFLFSLFQIKAWILNRRSWISSAGFPASFFSFIGVLNIFWDNDPGFGIFIFLLSVVCYPPINVLYNKLTGRTIPSTVKIVSAVFILWANTGVGELFDKIIWWCNRSDQISTTSESAHTNNLLSFLSQY